MQITIQKTRTREHTHFLLEDGTIIKIEKFPHMRIYDTINFLESKPLSVDMDDGPLKVSLEKPYDIVTL